ncbi:TetR/AcrR family transcriptional regulator [Acidaminococcus fermentans]|uniref:TetR family transcriptional regulator n=1 Tax=Acidaminococcus fermentans TaxID=905 RepID=UPI00242A40BB|nr:TetR/AcrR family transcriptional regulator [Acidaminococcus fermentans]
MENQKQEAKKQRKKLTLRQKRNMMYFVEATEKILKEEGVPGVTIRRIAAEAGYNSATLYNYFQDLDELVLFGSVCFLRDYLLDLARQLKTEMTSLERYQTIYRCFNESAFQYPEIFYNMFFGRYSAKLGYVIQIYYLDLFPEELQGLPVDVREMVIQGTLVERDQVVMKSLVKEGYVARERAAETLEIIVALHGSYIHRACLLGSSLDRPLLEKQFLHIFNYVLAAASPRERVPGEP